MQEKLRLDVDALRVDTFVAQDRPMTRGTVNAHDVDDSTLPVCSAAAGCQTGAAACSAVVACHSNNASCATACMTTPCCPYTVTCPPSYTCP